jgi:hypothetical protein
MTNPDRELTLAEATAEGRLEDFIRQQEAKYAPAKKREVLAALRKTIKPPRSKGRTSRSA